MTATQTTAYLAAHSIRTRTVNGTLQAEALYSVTRNGRTRGGRGWVTVQGWTFGQLRDWLGY